MLVRFWKSSSQAQKCYDQKNEEANQIKKIVLLPGWGEGAGENKIKCCTYPKVIPPEKSLMAREGCIDTVSLPIELLQFQAILQLFPSLSPHFLQLFVLLGKFLHGLVDISASVVTGLLVDYFAPKLFQLLKSFQRQKEKWDLAASGNMNSLSSQLFALLAVPTHQVSLPLCYHFPAGYALQSAAVLLLRDTCWRQ